MKLISIISSFIIFLILNFQHAFALQIVSPKEGQIFNAGDEFTIIAKPDEGEEWKTVILGFLDMTYSDSTKDYRGKASIPSDAMGTITFKIAAFDHSGNILRLKRNINVKMPPDVVLKSIAIYPDYIVLYKLLPEDPEKEKEEYGKENLSVDGQFSDGVERDLTDSRNGTSYSSSNNNVITVSPDGTVTAQSPGKAHITVKNDKYKTEVTVEVLPVKRYPDGRIKIY